MPQTLSRVYSAELEGIEARLIEIEVDLNIGLHAFNIVGLADKALSEAKERVSSAVKNTGFRPPTKENRKITVNLAPADIKKTGTQYDLAIAVGYLQAAGQIKPFTASKTIFIGELALDGKLRSVPGALNTAVLARERDMAELVLPRGNAREASLIGGLDILPADSLAEVINHLEGKFPIEPHPHTRFEPTEQLTPDIADVRGQPFAKRALTVAAAGGHNLLMVGPPGSGKTMLARALVSILPPLTLEEAVEISQIWSSVGLLKGSYAKSRPFRAPHQTASPVAVVGGGTQPKAGEISLAHRGVLFLDELPEFRRDLLEALRQPVEAGEVTISRVNRNLNFPARFMLVAAMNPCPCGFWGDSDQECRCSANEVFRYQKKISGPLLDRIDIQINVSRIKAEELQATPQPGESRGLRQTVREARELQRGRFRQAGLAHLTNNELGSQECERLASVTPEGKEFIKNIFDQTALSTRGYYRILKVARTIADLETSRMVNKEHLAEAFQLRVRESQTI